MFEENYQLMSLDEVETFIQTYRHLPGIPSAKEVVKTGIDVAEMNALLLEKIEELTLYVLELRKELDEINKKQ